MLQRLFISEVTIKLYTIIDNNGWQCGHRKYDGFHALNTYFFVFLFFRMAECGASECNLTIDDFVRTGRTGRRNALPDVLAMDHANVTTAGLPEVLENFTMDSSTETNPSAQSSQGQPQAEKME